jgi:hypothetical protein
MENGGAAAASNTAGCEGSRLNAQLPRRWRAIVRLQRSGCGARCVGAPPVPGAERLPLPSSSPSQSKNSKLKSQGPHLPLAPTD